jgi:Fe-S cluster assembly protein SufD
MRKEPAWLLTQRSEALRSFLQGAAPDRAQHLWRYSDPAQFEPAVPLWGGDGAGNSDSATSAASAPRAKTAAVAPELSGEAQEKGVVLLSLAAAAAHSEYGPLVQQHLGALIGAEFGRFEALNQALWRHGLFLLVPKGVQLQEELNLDFTSARAEACRLLAFVGEGSEVTLIERHHNAGASHRQLYGVSEIFAGPASRLTHMLVQTLNEGTVAHLTQRIRLAKDARALSSILSLGGKSMKLDTGTLLAGEGSEVETIGLLYGRGRQAFDHHTVHHHSAPHTNSNLDFKAVVTGRARSAYTGNITIEKEAPFSSAYQQNNNLLLNEKARAESIPELEIKVDEVQCSHGATVGQIDPDELFYLMSRGIPEKEAVRQIVRGFLEAILQRVPEKLQDPLRDELDSRLQEI